MCVPSTGELNPDKRTRRTGDTEVHRRGDWMAGVRGNARVCCGVLRKHVDDGQPTDAGHTRRDHVVRRRKHLHLVAEPLDTVRQPIGGQPALEHHLLALSHALIGQRLSTSTDEDTDTLLHLCLALMPPHHLEPASRPTQRLRLH